MPYFQAIQMNIKRLVEKLKSGKVQLAITNKAFELCQKVAQQVNADSKYAHTKEFQTSNVIQYVINKNIGTNDIAGFETPRELSVHIIKLGRIINQIVRLKMRKIVDKQGSNCR